MADLLDLYEGLEPDVAERAKAQAAALQRMRGAAMLGQLTGDKVLAPFGKNLGADVERQQEQLNAVPEQRLRMALQNAQLGTDKLQQQKMQADLDASTKRRGMLADPGSVPSQIRGKLAQAFGIPVPQGTPGEAIDDKELELAERFRAMQEQAAMRREIAAERKAGRKDVETDKELQKLKDDLDPNKGRAGEFGKNQARVNAAARIKALTTDPLTGGARDLTPQEMTELASSLASMISSGGQATEGVIKEFTPHSRAKSFGEFMQWLTNEPHGAGQKAFVERMMHTADREAETANKAIRTTQAQRLGAYPTLLKDRRGDVERLLSGYGIDPSAVDFEKGGLKPEAPPKAPAAVAPHPQDSAAVAWAKKNPNDPRAKKILELAGGQ